jgi:hypothetical protein
MNSVSARINFGIIFDVRISDKLSHNRAGS